MPGGDAVNQVGGGDAAAIPPSQPRGLDEIIEEEAQDDGIPIHPGGVHDPEAVGVGVHRRTQVRLVARTRRDPGGIPRRAPAGSPPK